MQKPTAFVVIMASGLALASCDSADDASSNLEVETVEVPAEAALEGVSEGPVADSAAGLNSADASVPDGDPVADEAASEAEAE